MLFSVSHSRCDIRSQQLTVCWSVVDMEMSFLQTFTVVTLRVAQTEETLLQEGILLVPEGKCDMLVAMSVTNTSNTIFTPSESSRASLIVREMAPSITIMRIVFPDSSPLSLSSVATPSFPVFCTFAILFQPLLFFTEVLMVVNDNHVVYL